ncbi:hypothetical protein IAI10_22295 [Clostridium sp. 19966]|uniref:DUF6465 family protein n=1 Tax=Clostridium sp. 19966 TaxID=2768166 RepID=UPI0028E064D6|nr:DUF6465 family protein [Clostridium sp. 19966]MDT8719388.1 hypothetical protein [Clostridium sp. 19966]
MKSDLYIQFNGNEICESEIIKKVKEVWVSEGNKIKELKNLSVYFKVEDKTAYCVINEDKSISIPL